MTYRQQAAARVRRAAADAAERRPAPEHRSNSDERRWRDASGRRPSYVASFTKCLPHDEQGFLLDPCDYEEWVRAIDSGDPHDAERLRIGPGPFQRDGDLRLLVSGDAPRLSWAADYAEGDEPEVRAWESQGAGSTFSLEGPDAQSVTMPPAPALDSQELVAEMAEVYWMALCRDVSFADWQSEALIADARASLARLAWFREDRTGALTGSTDALATSRGRRRVLSADGTAPAPLERLFRGTAPGEEVGPYVSQLLLIGSPGVNRRDRPHTVADGFVADGALRIDQRVRAAAARDYMTTWEGFRDVQNGAALDGRELYEPSAQTPDAPAYRFISRPRDLATYVHYDALYEAYLNACLLLLSLDAPSDPGLPFERADFLDKQSGFAQFGPPHVLTLVTEVATRALKAVRYQKYNVHRRLRPEAVGGWLYQLRTNTDPEVQGRLTALEGMVAAFDDDAATGTSLGRRVSDANHATNGTAPGGADNWLLPMAFAEGSPAHPSYGAGHATVAGACVTILKAWFDTGAPLLAPDPADPTGDARVPVVYEATRDGSDLVDVSGDHGPLTIEGELNKIGANISIGRNWAGVHYYSDYVESFRMGEEIAVRLLEEQKATYAENFSLTVPLVDGSSVRI